MNAEDYVHINAIDAELEEFPEPNSYSVYINNNKHIKNLGSLPYSEYKSSL